MSKKEKKVKQPRAKRMPTILEALGNKIEGKGIYLGRSLFSGEPTLVEKYNESFVENETMTKNTVYESYK